MLGLTPLGAVHTAISLIALVAGFVALWRYKEISTGTLSGQTFVGGTRLPAGAPYLSNPDDPKAQPIIGFFFLLFLVGATLQVLRPRRIQPS